MAIQDLQLVSFRNHDQKEFKFIQGLTVIWGENGSGKTSVLEAIHILSYGKSFRTHKQRDLIKNSESSFIARGDFSTNGHRDNVAAQVTQTNGQKLKLNGKLLSGRKALLGRNNVVVLSPEEQSVTKGAPKERRQFFDKMFSVVSKEYVDCLQDYSRILKQRNAALILVKENQQPMTSIQSWDEQLVEKGKQLWSFRFDFISEFKVYLKHIIFCYDNSIDLNLRYLDCVPTVETYQLKIKDSLQKDITMGRTSYGPHRDDISLIWESRDLRSFGSQGEHKLSLVFLKLSEMIFIRKKTGSHPTLLLDDLFAKLDLERSKKIVSLLQNLETETGEQVQTIVTTTDIVNVEQSGLLDGRKKNKTYHLERLCST